MKQNENRSAQTKPINGDLFDMAIAIHNEKPKLTKKQKSAFDLLKSGKFSAAEISAHLFCSSGRDVVRKLIAKGICVRDEWVNKNGVQFKRFWIE